MPLYLLVAADFVKTGGMDRANYALADHLARRGDEVHLVAHSAGSGLLQQPNVRWHRVPKPLGSDALAWPLLDRIGRRWARRLARRGGHVVVNGGNCQWGDLNWVHYVHAVYASPVAGGALPRAWQKWKNGRALADERRALPRARVAIANSERTRRDLIAGLGLAPERTHCVYYGCDPELFAPILTPERRRVRESLGIPDDCAAAIFIGALGDRRKGFDTLLAAWQRLAAAPGWNAMLLVVGRGRELPAWRQRVRTAGLESSIRFLGFRGDVPRLLAACDLMIAPARYEAFGLGVQEALARGVPAIVSASAGVAERMTPALQAMCLHDSESVDELTFRIRAWQAQAPTLAAEAQRLGAVLRRYTWDDMAARILDLAESAANGNAFRNR